MGINLILFEPAEKIHLSVRYTQQSIGKRFVEPSKIVGVEELLDLPVSKQLAEVDSYARKRAAKLLDAIVLRATDRQRQPVSYSLLERLYEIADPEQHIEIAQDADDRVAVSKESLARIRADTLRQASSPRAARATHCETLEADAAEVRAEVATLEYLESIIASPDPAKLLTSRSHGELVNLLSSLRDREDRMDRALRKLEVVISTMLANFGGSSE